EHYYAFGGKSPINEQNIALRQALADELAARGLDLPVIWGNRNWHPYTVDALRDAHAFGARPLLAVLPSPSAHYCSPRPSSAHLNWPPYTVDALRDAHAFGARRLLVILTSAYASYSSTRQYREHLAASLADLGPAGEDLQLDILRPFFNDPGFIGANLDAIR